MLVLQRNDPMPDTQAADGTTLGADSGGSANASARQATRAAAARAAVLGPLGHASLAAKKCHTRDGLSHAP